MTKRGKRSWEKKKEKIEKKKEERMEETRRKMMRTNTGQKKSVADTVKFAEDRAVLKIGHPPSTGSELVSGKGKAVADYNSDSDDSPPETLPLITFSSKKNPDMKKMDLLSRPDLERMDTWSTDDYSKYDKFLVKKWECCGWDERDRAYVILRDYHSKVAWTARTFYHMEWA